jgi:hypothetical protein
MRLPKPKGTKGRPHIHKKPTRPFISIQEYADTLKKKHFSFLPVRHASKGKLKAYFHKRSVYIINPHTAKCMELTLLIRKDADGTLKFSLCNAPQDVTLKELAYQQSKRYFIERNFQDTKQELGLDDYQCQSEIAWERHMSLCMLAMLFINQEKCENLQEVGIYLSASDIKKMIAAIILYNQTKQQRIFKEIFTKTQMTKAKAKKNVYIRI